MLAYIRHKSQYYYAGQDSNVTMVVWGSGVPRYINDTLEYYDYCKINTIIK